MFGDLIADEFIYGEIARVSREAPVLILNYDSTEIVPGGAGNAASNVAALGGAAALVGVVGRDEAGRRLLRRAVAAASTSRGVVRPRGYRTPTKTRILAGGIHSAKQQVVRIDRAGPQPVDDTRRAIAFEARVQRASAARRAARLRLRQRARHARARRRGAADAAQPRTGWRRRSWSTRATPAAVPRDDGVHAERVRGRAGARRPHRRRTRARSSAPGARCSTRPGCRPC